jgi:hypothetical protein
MFEKRNKYFWIVLLLTIILSFYMFTSFPTNTMNFCQR